MVKAVCGVIPNERPERNRHVLDRSGTLGEALWSDEEDAVGGEAMMGGGDTLGDGSRAGVINTLGGVTWTSELGAGGVSV